MVLIWASPYLVGSGKGVEEPLFVTYPLMQLTCPSQSRDMGWRPGLGCAGLF